MWLTVLENVIEQGWSNADVVNSFRVLTEQGGSAGDVVNSFRVCNWPEEALSTFNKSSLRVKEDKNAPILNDISDWLQWLT